VVVLAWLILGVVLLAVEIRHLAFFALFGAAGSFAAALVAVFLPSAYPLPIVTALKPATIIDALLRLRRAEPGWTDRRRPPRPATGR